MTNIIGAENREGKVKWQLQSALGCGELKDTPNTSEGFRFVAFVILEILGWVYFDPPPPLVLGVGTKPLVPEGLICSCNQYFVKPLQVVIYEST